MADKEERILIIKITSDPYTCDIGGICKDKVCLETLCEMGMPRQELAEKIKDALTYYAWYYDLQNTRHKTVIYGLIAQAILHSILEGVKNEK